MALIKSISGIRGTIGGKPGEGLTPLDIVKFTSAYGTWLKTRNRAKPVKVVVGRDARISGEMVMNLVNHTLCSLGIDVICLDFATTPTVEIAVPEEKAQGGIILTASHNPREWNALKLLNEKGEFISADDGKQLLEIADNENFNYDSIDKVGIIRYSDEYDDIHIRKILELGLVDIEAIKTAKLTIAIDCVNSVGGIIIPKLLKMLGVKNIIELYCDATGEFPHNPEPLPEHLTKISSVVKEQNADLGFVVDPDVDRLAIINEDGSMFGEEYTLVAVSDYILQHTPGNTVSNLSSSRALRDITNKYPNCLYTAAAVGEVNVVSKMKETQAVIGGEGNGGVIYPKLHSGRDALAGIALFLSHLARSGKKCSELRASYPEYVISKNKIQLTTSIDVDQLLSSVKERFKDEKINDIDGIKIDFENEWVHLRKSNTEPIIRIYAESDSKKAAEELAQKVIGEIQKLI